MTGGGLKRDPELADLLGEIAGNAADERTDWTALQQAIAAGAASELARRRGRSRWRRMVIPASLAAGIALFVALARAPGGNGSDPSAQSAASGQVTIDELLDADLSDGQFRALVSGAGDATDLLAIAAQDDRP